MLAVSLPFLRPCPHDVVEVILVDCKAYNQLEIPLKTLKMAKNTKKNFRDVLGPRLSPSRNDDDNEFIPHLVLEEKDDRDWKIMLQRESYDSFKISAVVGKIENELVQFVFGNFFFGEIKENLQLWF